MLASIQVKSRDIYYRRKTPTETVIKRNSRGERNNEVNVSKYKIDFHERDLKDCWKQVLKRSDTNAHTHGQQKIARAHQSPAQVFLSTLRADCFGCLLCSRIYLRLHRAFRMVHCFRLKLDEYITIVSETQTPIGMYNVHVHVRRTIVYNCPFPHFHQHSNDNLPFSLTLSPSLLLSAYAVRVNQFKMLLKSLAMCQVN